MWMKLGLLFLAGLVAAEPKSSEELVSKVLRSCGDMGCVKENVLEYLDSVLQMKTDARGIKDIDQAIFKRAARVLKTHEFRFKLPQMLFNNAEVVYNPRSGLDITDNNVAEERGLGLKKKLLFPILLLFKLKMKALMPIFVALIGVKALKALILSKLAILIVIGFIAYQFLSKSGMPMPPMSMAPIEPPMSMYGPPSPPPSSPPSSYEPGWEPSGSGPYARVWTSSGSAENAQNMAYNAYYQASSTSTLRP